ncbi:MAG: glycopeptide antibiotics resistance protein [Planctomycetota bacterium]|jgi:glycopeptide antibiotics resistance protein
MRERNRRLIFVLLLATTVSGLASRKFDEELPEVIATYAGDVLWAIALYWFLSLLLERRPITLIATSALLTSFAVECSQLYQAPWIDGLRGTVLGGLLLGHGFLWSDLLCYTLGIVIAATVDAAWLSRPARSDS